MKNVFMKKEDNFLISRNALSLRESIITYDGLKSLGFNIDAFKRKDMSVEKARLTLTRNKEEVLKFINENYPTLLTTKKDMIGNDVVHTTSTIARFSRVVTTLALRKIK
jgi:hypothetical protein